MNCGFAPSYQEIIDACDALHFRMPQLRDEHPNDESLLAAWLPQAMEIIRRADMLDQGYDDRVVFQFVADRCDEMLESIGLQPRGEPGYDVYAAGRFAGRDAPRLRA